jgi:hypothetical protein
MQIGKSWQCGLALCLALTGTSFAQTIAFNGAVTAGTAINVTGTKETVAISVYKVSGANCDASIILDPTNPPLHLVPNLSAPTAIGSQVTVDPSTKPSITLASPVGTGDKICLVAIPAATPDAPIFSAGIATVSAAPGAAVPNPSFADPLITGTYVTSVNGKAGDTIAIYAFAPTYKPLSSTKNAVGASLCELSDIPSGPLQLALQNPGGGATITTLKLTAATQPISFQSPLTSGSQLCIVDLTASNFSYFATVQDPQVAINPSINGKLVTSSASPTSQISVYGEPGASMEIFQLDDNDAQLLGCAPAIAQGKATQLQIASAGLSAAPTASATLGTAPGPYAITLSNSLTAGTDICLEQSVKPTSGAGQTTTQYSSVPWLVQDGDNPYPKLRTFYTAGAMINNENGSSSSTTGAEYLDIGLAFTLIPDSGKPHWNWASSISGRFSSIPVTAPSATAAPSSTTPSSSGTLNILSSQESGRVLGATALTIGDARKNLGYQIFSGPVAKAGFDTLLNPSATATSGASGSTTVVAQFAPVYTEFSGGWRMGLRHFNSSIDNSPRTVAQLDITIGKFSNLQSFVCNPKVTTTVTTQPTNTSCYTPQTSGASSYTLDQQSRITLLRPEVSGFVNLGSSNFVLGLDANLPQSVDAPKLFDVQNKAGGSVIIYFGYSGSLTGLFNSLKLPGSSQ